MFIKVSKGGHAGGIYGNTQIYPNKVVLGNLVDVAKGNYNLFKTLGTISPELIAFHGGEYFPNASPTFQIYNSVNVLVYSNAFGGAAYPSYINSKSITIVYNSRLMDL